MLIDLPEMRAQSEAWVGELGSPVVECLWENLLYSRAVLDLEPFEVVWATGVLYHNPEQLRMVRRLYDLLVGGGLVVLESATARTPALRDQNCVEIVYPPSAEYKRRYHVSANVTHLPSRRAIESWMAMVGFDGVVRSSCHRRVSRALARDRAAFIGRRPEGSDGGCYYTIHEGARYVIGRAI